jgi:hypothetical protein
MKNNVLVAIGAIFIILLIGWFVTRDDQPKVGIKELKVEKIKPDDVSRIEITVPPKEPKKKTADGDGALDDKDDAPAAVATTVVLERDGKGFVVSSSADAKKQKHPVDEAQLKPLLDAIGELQAGDVVANKAEKLKDFEIDDAHGTHVVISTSKGKAIDLLFGRAAKGGGTTVREQGKNDVFVAKGRLGALVKKDASQWRKKSIVDKKADDFTTVTVVQPDGQKIVLDAETKEEPAPPAEEGKEAPAPKVTTTWTLTEPATLPAGFRLDDNSLGRVASSLATLRAADFADDVDDATAGFVAPHTVITAKGKDGKDVVLHLGAKDDKKRVYARVDGDPQVYLVAEYAVKNVDKGLDDLRDLTLFTARLDDVTQLKVSAGTTDVVVKQDGADWKLVEPKTPPAEFDAAQIPSVVGAALRLKGTRIASGVTDAGGSDPVVELTLTSGKKETVRFGKGVVEEGAKAGDKPREVYAKGADGQVYVVSSFTKTRYEKPTDLFKKPPAPPPGMGGLNGLEGLPPDVRKKLEASMRAQGLKHK